MNNDNNKPSSSKDGDDDDGGGKKEDELNQNNKKKKEEDKKKKPVNKNPLSMANRPKFNPYSKPSSSSGISPFSSGLWANQGNKGLPIKPSNSSNSRAASSAGSSSQVAKDATQGLGSVKDDSSTTTSTGVKRGASKGPSPQETKKKDEKASPESVIASKTTTTTTTTASSSKTPYTNTPTSRPDQKKPSNLSLASKKSTKPPKKDNTKQTPGGLLRQKTLDDYGIPKTKVYTGVTKPLVVDPIDDNPPPKPFKAFGPGATSYKPNTPKSPPKSPPPQQHHHHSPGCSHSEAPLTMDDSLVDDAPFDLQSSPATSPIPTSLMPQLASSPKKSLDGNESQDNSDDDGTLTFDTGNLGEPNGDAKEQNKSSAYVPYKPKISKTSYGSKTVEREAVLQGKDLRKMTKEEVRARVEEVKKEDDKQKKEDEARKVGSVVGFASRIPIPVKSSPPSSPDLVRERLPANEYDNEERNALFGTNETIEIRTMNEFQLQKYWRKERGEGGKYFCLYPGCNCFRGRKVDITKHIKEIAHGRRVDNVLVDKRLTPEEIRQTYQDEPTLMRCRFAGCKQTYNKKNGKMDKNVLKNMKYHYRQSHGSNFDRPYQCNFILKHGVDHEDGSHDDMVICTRRFGSKGNLTNHQSNHVKAYQCTEGNCTSRFASSTFLQQHIRAIHLKQKPFKCSSCEKSFSNSWMLTWHEEKHNPIIVKCVICQAKCPGLFHLHRHLVNHLYKRNQSVKCPIDGCIIKVLECALEHHIQVKHRRYDDSYCCCCDMKITSDDTYRKHINSPSHKQKFYESLSETEGSLLEFNDDEFYEEIVVVPSKTGKDCKICECEDGPENCSKGVGFYHKRFICDCRDKSKCLNNKYGVDAKEIKFHNFTLKINSVIKCSTKQMVYLWIFTDKKNETKKYHYVGQVLNEDGFIARTDSHFRRGYDSNLSQEFFIENFGDYNVQVIPLFSVPNKTWNPWIIHAVEILLIRVLETQNTTRGFNQHGGGPFGYVAKVVEGLGEGASEKVDGMFTPDEEQ